LHSTYLLFDKCLQLTGRDFVQWRILVRGDQVPPALSGPRYDARASGLFPLVERGSIADGRLPELSSTPLYCLSLHQKVSAWPHAGDRFIG
jgi:hypothetical protein